MPYAILHIPSQGITNKYGIAASFCNLAIGDHDLSRYHLSDDLEYIQHCLKYYKTKWPQEKYEVCHIETLNTNEIYNRN